MELTTILGIIVGILAVVVAMIFKHISFAAFSNPAALTIIFAGTIACVLNAFTGHEIKNIGKLFKILFTKYDTSRKSKLIDTICEFAQSARKEGLLSLENKVEALEDEFLKRGVRMVVDSASEDYIRDVLSIEMEQIKERHGMNAGIFSQAGMYAPTLGVLGAVFGLIAAMGSINDTAAMSEAIAAAFMATILGIFTGYVLWNPFANKLKLKDKHEMVEKRIILEGVLSILNGDHPDMIKDKLRSFLTAKEKTSTGE